MKTIFTNSMFSRKKVLYSWLRSFAVLTTAIVVMIIVSYSLILNRVESQQARINQAAVTRLRQQMDGQLAEVESLAVQVHNDPHTATIVISEGKDIPLYSYAYRELIGLFRVFASTHPFIESIHLAMPNSGLTVSTSGIQDWTNTETVDSLRSVLSIRSYRLQTIQSGEKHDWLCNENGELFYTREYPWSPAEAPAILIIKIDKRRQKTILDRMQSEYDGLLFITSGPGQVILDTDPSAANFLSEIRSIEGTQGTFTLPGSKAIVSHTPSTHADLHYYSVVSKALFLKDTAGIRITALTSILAVLIIGAVFFRYFVIRNYLPIKQILDSFETTVDSIPKDANEYERLRIYSRKLLERHRITTEQLLELKRDLRNQYWERLLKGVYLFSEVKAGIGDALELKTESACFHLIQIAPAHTDHPPGLLRLYLSDIALDTLPGISETVTISSDDSLFYLVLSISGFSKKMIPAIRRSLERTIETIDEGTGLRPVAVISGEFDSLDEIHEIYLRCRARMTDVLFFSEGPVSVVDNAESSRFLFLDEKRQRMLAGRLMEGNAGDAKQVAEEILGVLSSSEHRNVDLSRCMASTLYTTIIQAVSASPAGNNSFFESNMNISGEFFTAGTILEMKEMLFRLIDVSCESIMEARKSRNRLLYNKILEYVDLKIHDPSLYIPAIAEAFIINPKYLSSFFKEQCGIGLSEYIREKRIELAKQLLCRNLPVKSIAEKTGFGNVVTFNRAFRKHVNMTPSEYREGIRIGNLNLSAKE